MYKKFHAKNGLTVITSRMPQMTSVSLGIWIGVGGRYESTAESGISHLIEHMVFKGTHARTAKELKESIEGIGGAFNGFTSDEATCYMVKVPAKYMKLGMDILTDMVLNAKFSEEDLLREKFVVCEEIKMYRDQPADHVLDLLSQIMWPGNALGRPLTGTSRNVKGFKKNELLKFKNKNYHPNNIAVVAVGKVDPEKVFSYAVSKFQKQKKKKKYLFKTPLIKQKTFHAKFHRGNTKQTYIAIGFPVRKQNIRQRSAMRLMNIIFGGNMSSRLFDELREKQGLCYDIASSYKRHSDIEELQIHAGVDTMKAFRSVVAILDELKKIRDSGVTKDELVRAKEYAKGQFLLAMEGTSTRMLFLGDRFIVHKNIPAVKDILKQIDGVTSDEIHKVCGEIFRASSINLAMIGDSGGKEKDKLKRELKRL